jgi:hypothetical protein
VSDLDLALLDASGRQLSSSEEGGSSEQITSPVNGGESYIFRVKGWANGPTQFTIMLDEAVAEEDQGSASTSESSVTGDMTMELVKFRVNPVNGTITRVNTSEVNTTQVVEAEVVEAEVAPVNGASFTL